MDLDNTNTTCTDSVRPTLGFFVSELENAYAQTLCRGITDAAAEADANVIIFPGKSPKVPYFYRYQHNAIYRLAARENVSALILATGTMVNFLSDGEFRDFYSRYSGIPLVSISIPIEGASSVVIDNKAGLREALRHLVKEHRYKRIAFVGGPESNVEAQERFDVYREVLAENGIPFDPSLVVVGDFTKYSGVRAVCEFADERRVSFQALACANDEMALSAMEELKRRGCEIPEEVAVIGFDNVESAHYSTPTLTTVAQPIYEQAYNAVKLALELIGGGAARNVSLPTSMALRESCGCFSRAVTSVGASVGDGGGAASESGDAAEAGQGSGGSAAEVGDGGDAAEVEAALRRAVDMAAAGSLSDAAALELLKDLTRTLNAVASDREEKLRRWQNTVTDVRARAGLRSFDAASAAALEDFFHKARVLLLETYFKNDSKRWGIHHNGIVGLRDVLSLLISDVNNTRGALRSIIPNLRELGMSCFYVFLHESAEVHEIDTDWDFKKSITLVVADDDLPGSSDLIGMNIPVMSILDRHFYPKDRRYTFVVSSLFYMNEHIGFVVCEPNFNDIYLFESLVVEISCSLKLISLIQTRQTIERKLQTALEELEKYNEQLSSISETDELTKLLNRRGFLNHARHMLGMARRMKKDGILFFADLDGLKGINDTYGHEEGDNAIKTLAASLRHAFRESDVLARLGGDEFTIFTLNTHPEMLDTFEKRIEGYLEDYNGKSEKPYKVLVSIGAVPFKCTDVVDIETLMSKADALLYQQKKEKKARIAEMSMSDVP